MNISAWAIRNPVPVILLFLILTVLGLIGFKRLSIQNFPNLDVPVVTVNAALEGTAPSQLETEVVRKIEDKIATVPGVKHLISNITDGNAMIIAEFVNEKNSEEALSQVKNAVDTVRRDLPQEMALPIVSKLDVSGSPVLTYAISSESMSESELSWFIDNELNKALSSVKGVGKIERIGGVDREILIELDETEANRLGINANTISNQLKLVQKDFSGGEAKIGSQTQSFRTFGSVKTIDELAALTIPLNNGRYVLLGQIAEIRDTNKERSSIAFYDQKQVVALQISRSINASEVFLAHAIRDKIDELRAVYPTISFTEVFNTVTHVEENYESSMQLLYEGAFLAIVVVFFFLKDWRATFISATALPLSIIPTFAMMYFLDFSLNLITLLSLALVVGILVDDAIVEVENIVRHMRLGKTAKEAADDATQEIGLAVFATTFTLVAVFLPTVFLGGTAGQFFRQFGLTVAISVMFSLLVARLLTPMMAAFLLKPHHQEEKDSTLMKTYLKMAFWCQTHCKTTMLLATLFFVGSISLVTLLPTGFMPPNDNSQTQVKIELPPGTNLEETLKTAMEVEKLLLQYKDVKHVFSAVGSGLSISSGPVSIAPPNDPKIATMVLVLTPRTERDYSQTDIEVAIRGLLKDVVGAKISVGGGNVGETLDILLVGDDSDLLQKTGLKVEQELRTLSNIGAITSSNSLQQPEIQILPNYELAAKLGVTNATLANVIRNATTGDISELLGKFNLPDRQLDIRVKMSDDMRNDLDSIGQIRVPTAKGSVMLSNIAEIKIGSGASEIQRRDRLRQTTIKVEIGKRIMGELQAEAFNLPTLKNLPKGITLQASGDAESMQELFDSFGIAMLIGVMCIFIILVLLFQDFLQPITILAALPLSVGGALLSLLLTNNSFSMPSSIGLLMLMGIVTKNSILLVEYAILARKNYGLSRLDALMDACHKRARPIVMTTIAMGLGMLPIALGFGADPSFRSPMAIVVIGGLITSTFLSLLVIPVVFIYIDDLSKFLKRAIGVK